MQQQHSLELPQTVQQIKAFETYIRQTSDSLAGVVIEPLIQGAGGMKFHAPEVLQTIRKTCDQFGILMIADEIATGFGANGHFVCRSAG